MTIEAVILAAGYSSRMNCFKPLLRLGGETLLAHCTATFHREQIRASVVSGHRADEVADEAARLGLFCLHNPDYDQGMFSSVRHAVARLADIDAFFLLPVDVPLIYPATIAALIARFDGRTVLIPTFGGKKGHPPLVPARFLPEQYIGINLRGVGVIFFLLFTVIIGWLAKGLIGRSLIRWGESIVDRLPLVRSVYGGVKQIAETVFAQSENNFDKACLIQYPRPGVWAIGFISTEAKGEIARKIPVAEDKVAVFMPTTPNPTSGFLMFLPRKDVIELDLSIEDAAKLIISAGLVYPPGVEAAESRTEAPALVNASRDRIIGRG